jgi:hypothetical protein
VSGAEELEVPSGIVAGSSHGVGSSCAAIVSSMLASPPVGLSNNTSK